MADRKRALIVDDDDPIRTMLAKVVSKQDLEVDTARDGEEAITRLKAQPYSVVLLDLMMPRVDGYAVLRYIQAHDPEQLKCTIIASAVPESEFLRQFDIPVFRIHAKPFDLQKLVADIQKCVEGAAA